MERLLDCSRQSSVLCYRRRQILIRMRSLKGSQTGGNVSAHCPSYNWLSVSFALLGSSMSRDKEGSFVMRWVWTQGKKIKTWVMSSMYIFNEWWLNNSNVVKRTHLVWIRKTNYMSLFVLFISFLIVAQHVLSNHVPIIRSWWLRDVIASCWHVPWLQGGGQVRLVGSASMDGFVATYSLFLF